jgi:hypothetical protein
MGFFTSILPRWATAPTAQIVEPNEGKKDAGWIAEAPPHDYFNWLLRRTYDCLLQIDAAVSAATASVLVVRDSSGRAQVIDPSVAADIDTMGARDTAIGVETTARTNADSSHANLTNPHSATAAATASRLVLRDASGRAAFADPSAVGDADTMGARNTAIAAYVAPWTDNDAGIVAGTGWTITAAKLSKRHGIVYMAFQASAGATATATVATLPSGYRPMANISFGCGVRPNTGSIKNAIVTGGGSVLLDSAPANGDNYDFGAMFRES